MATTTNYSWVTPDDTALVKDGAAAIRTLGSSIDTTTKALNPSTTLGDIEYRSSTANTNTRLGIGSTGNVLTVAGGVPTWAAPAGGSAAMTQIASGSISAVTSVSISSLTSYDTLVLQISGIYWGSFQDELALTINNNTGGNYRWAGGYNATGDSGYTESNGNNRISMNCDQNQKPTNADNSFVLTLENCKAAGFTNYALTCGFRKPDSAITNGFLSGVFTEAAAVSSIKFQSANAYTINGGAYVLWGA